MNGPDFPSRGVYFIRQGSSGPVKIGWSKNVPARIRDLEQGFVEPGELLAVLPALDAGTEERIHRLLRRDHHRGEWFQPTAWVMALVAGVRALNDGAEPLEVEGIPFAELPKKMLDAAKRRPKRGDL